MWAADWRGGGRGERGTRRKPRPTLTPAHLSLGGGSSNQEADLLRFNPMGLLWRVPEWIHVTRQRRFWVQMLALTGQMCSCSLCFHDCDHRGLAKYSSATAQPFYFFFLLLFLIDLIRAPPCLFFFLRLLFTPLTLLTPKHDSSCSPTTNRNNSSDLPSHRYHFHKSRR